MISVASIIGTASVSGIVSEREGDTDNTEEQESAVGGKDGDDAGEGPSAAGHPAAPTPSTTRDTDNTEEQESAVGGKDGDDAGEGPSAAGHPAAPTPSTTSLTLKTGNAPQLAEVYRWRFM
ncbi:unnamed protein product [Gadus morhua 'NCC']